MSTCPGQGGARSGAPKEILLLGEGPVASAIARVADASGFRVAHVARDFAGLPAPGPSAHVVVATGHAADEEALAFALRGTPRTVQLVASARRVPLVLDALRGAGVGEEKLALLRSPAGLDLGGDSPGEIALSILAEIVASSHGATGRPLSELKGTRSAPSSGASAPRVPPAAAHE